MSVSDMFSKEMSFFIEDTLSFISDDELFWLWESDPDLYMEYAELMDLESALSMFGCLDSDL